MVDVAALAGRFMRRHAPSRDEVLDSPLLKPFGQRIRESDLWRFTRRSVPRGVAIGLFVGIFLMVPGAPDRRRGAGVGAASGQYPDRRGDDLPVQPGDDALLHRSRQSMSATRLAFMPIFPRSRFSRTPMPASADGSPGCCPTRRRRWSPALPSSASPWRSWDIGCRWSDGAGGWPANGGSAASKPIKLSHSCSSNFPGGFDDGFVCLELLVAGDRAWPVAQRRRRRLAPPRSDRCGRAGGGRAGTRAGTKGADRHLRFRHRGHEPLGQAGR